MLGRIPQTVDDYRLLCSLTRNGQRDRSTGVLGEIGEKICSAVMAKSRFFFVPLCKASDGGAPLMLGEDKLILPDFDAKHPLFQIFGIFRRQGKGWPRTGESREAVSHGIDERNWQHYTRCQQIARQPSGLFIVECFKDADEHSDWSGALRVQSLKRLGHPCEKLGEEKPPKVYWPVKAFVELGTFAPQDFVRMVRGAWAPNYEDRLREIFAPMKQEELF